MAEFFWRNNPPSGSCVICDASVNERGFVDFIGDTLVIDRDGGGFTGVVDIYICATCVEQASRLVGCADRDQVEEFAYREIELVNENDKLKDEIQAHQQRWDKMMDSFKDEIRAEFSAFEKISEE